MGQYEILKILKDGKERTSNEIFDELNLNIRHGSIINGLTRLHKHNLVTRRLIKGRLGYLYKIKMLYVCEFCELQKETEIIENDYSFRICKECLKDCCNLCINKDKLNKNNNPICSECINLSKFKGGKNVK